MYLKLRYIIILIALCGLMTSCTSDTTAEPDAGAAVEVTFVTADPSRAVALSGINTEGSSFAIYGDNKFMNSDHFMNVFCGDPVTYRSGKWTYNGTQYWFPKYEYSFVAVYPAEAKGMSEAEYAASRLSFAYTLPETYSEASDLMVATHRRLCQYDENSTSSPQPVNLQFQHIMSRINFKVTNDKAADTVRVTEIKLDGLNRTGSFTIIPAPLLAGSRQTDDYDFAWSDISNKADLTADIRVDIPENESRELFPNGNALFMVPQPDNNSVMMHITYTLIDAGANDEQLTLHAQTPIGGWEPGKIYTYGLSVSEITKEICLTVSVKPWHPEKNTDITVPES